MFQAGHNGAHTFVVYDIPLLLDDQNLYFHGANLYANKKMFICPLFCEMPAQELFSLGEVQTCRGRSVRPPAIPTSAISSDFV